jgi:hypothetical protein
VTFNTCGTRFSVIMGVYQISDSGSPVPVTNIDSVVSVSRGSAALTALRRQPCSSISTRPWERITFRWTAITPRPVPRPEA